METYINKNKFMEYKALLGFLKINFMVKKKCFSELCSENQWLTVSETYLLGVNEDNNVLLCYKQV